MCGYKLATYQRNFTEIHKAYMKILQKVFGGASFFDSHCICLKLNIILMLIAVDEDFKPEESASEPDDE